MGVSQQACRPIGRCDDAKERRGSTRRDGGSRQEGSATGFYLLSDVEHGHPLRGECGRRRQGFKERR